MNTIAALVILRGYAAGARRTVHERYGDDVGASTLELVIIILGLIAVATMLVLAITAAVQRRVNQIT
jgi:DMSO/TMAO reductase YedYZ heme-binding membrane subunit